MKNSFLRLLNEDYISKHMTNCSILANNNNQGQQIQNTNPKC